MSIEDHTYKELKTLTNSNNNNNNKDVVRGDKDSSIVIMKRTDYLTKIEAMIEEGIQNGTYSEDFTRFQVFTQK